MDAFCFCRAAFNAVTELDFICLLSPNTGVLGGEPLHICTTSLTVHSFEKSDAGLCRGGSEGDLCASAASDPSWTPVLRLHLPQEAALPPLMHTPSQVE